MRRFVADASHELRTPLAVDPRLRRALPAGRRPRAGRGRRARCAGSRTRRPGWALLVEDLLLLARLDEQRPLAHRAGRPDRRSPPTPSQDARALAPDRDDHAARARRRRSAPTDGRRRRAPAAPGRHQPGRQRAAATPRAGTAGRGRRRADDGERRASLEVRDHGPGIDPEQAARVFERFYRADPSRQRGRGGGTGLGLAIVAALVAAHGGRVGVTADPRRRRDVRGRAAPAARAAGRRRPTAAPSELPVLGQRRPRGVRSGVPTARSAK